MTRQGMQWTGHAESDVPGGMEGSSVPSSSLPKPKPKIAAEAEMPPQVDLFVPSYVLVHVYVHVLV